MELDTLNRVEATCMVENLGSEKVMKKAGMTYEGTMRQYHYIKGRFHDVCLYAIVRGEER